MLISIGILARNEASSIGPLLIDLARQTLLTTAEASGRQVEILCVPNGCTDDTAQAAEREIALLQQQTGPSVRWRVHTLDEGGKANAWNCFVHELASAESRVMILLDADIRFTAPDTLARLTDLLESSPDAVAATPTPVKDLAGKTSRGPIARMLLRLSRMTQAEPGTICGQMYAARADAMRRIWMPRELLVEDGYLRAMIVTRLFTAPDDVALIQRDPQASYEFEAYTRLRDLFHHERRLAMGTAMNAHLFSQLWALGRQTDAGEWVRQRNAADPAWFARQWAEHARRHRRLLPRGAWRHRLRQLKHLPWPQRLRSFPAALAASLFTLAVHVSANRRLKRRAILDAW